MEVEGSRWKFPLSVEVEVSTTIIGGSFHELPYTSIYFHLFPRVSQTSRSLYKSPPTSITTGLHRLP